MESVILVIHLIVAIAIVAVVLVQPAQDAGFVGGSGSMSNLGATRTKGDALSRITGYLAAVFFITSMSLALLAEHHGPAKNILDVSTGQAAVTKMVPVKPAAAPAKAPEQKRPSAPISH
ncbi:MAG: preprotein translocase subunit SecG [Alphaproteobacteria bacterium]|nr:preprotein translocase subunit SecG [Alphaproteobacteria bacterium]